MCQHSSTRSQERKWFDSAHASLCLLGEHLRRTGFFRALEHKVKPHQKTRH